MHTNVSSAFGNCITFWPKSRRMPSNCMSTIFGVDSSSCFLLKHWLTHTHAVTDTTDHLTHELATTGIDNNVTYSYRRLSQNVQCGKHTLVERLQYPAADEYLPIWVTGRAGFTLEEALCGVVVEAPLLSLIHIWRCRRSTLCRSRWSPYH